MIFNARNIFINLGLMKLLFCLKNPASPSRTPSVWKLCWSWTASHQCWLSSISRWRRNSWPIWTRGWWKSTTTSASL